MIQHEFISYNARNLHPVEHLPSRVEQPTPKVRRDKRIADEQVGGLPGARRQHMQLPHERDGERDDVGPHIPGVEHPRGESEHILGVGDRGWPVESFSEGVVGGSGGERV